MKVKAAQNGNIVKNAEYILVYTKDGHKNIAKNLLYDNRPEYDKHYNKIIINGKLENLKEKFIDEIEPVFQKESLDSLYKKSEKFRKIIELNLDNIVADDKITGFDEEKFIPNQIYSVERDGKNFLLYHNGKKLRQLLRLSSSYGECDDFKESFGLRKIRGDWWKDFYLDMGNVSKEGNVIFENGKKPKRLIKQILKMSTNRDDIILDCFAGSGTTGHAILDLNKEDGGKRTFIEVEMADYVDSITCDRTRKVIDGYSSTKGTGGDFSYYELGESIFDNQGNLNSKLSIEEIRKYVFYTETQQEPEKYVTDYLGNFNETGYYFNYRKEEPTCLNLNYLKTIDKKFLYYVIYADTCILTKEQLKKYHIIFKKIPRDILRF